MSDSESSSELGFRASDYNSFVLSTGYAESTPLSTLTFMYLGDVTELRSTKLEAWNEAFGSLTSVLLSYAQDAFGNRRACCSSMSADCSFCSKCGKRVIPVAEEEDDESYLKHDDALAALRWLWEAENHQLPEELDVTQSWCAMDTGDPVTLRTFVVSRADEFVAWFNDHRDLLDHFWDDEVGFWDNIRVESVSSFSMTGV